MPDNPRIEELQRRVQKDPASIAFAQLAEEYRRSGDYDEAARVCRAGLDRHPSYVSARVTLGRALIELGQYDDAHSELDRVLRSAPENVAALRGIAEIHRRRGNLTEALRQYEIALRIAKHDPELEEAVQDLTRQLHAQTDHNGHGSEPDRRGALFASLSPEAEAAADEFTKALHALDALTLDLPTTSLPDDSHLPESEVEATPAAAELSGDEAVAKELESWLESIVRDRETRAPKS